MDLADRCRQLAAAFQCDSGSIASPLGNGNPEWVCLGEGKDFSKYRPVTELEMKTPWVFAALYVVLFIWSLLETFSG